MSWNQSGHMGFNLDLMFNANAAAIICQSSSNPHQSGNKRFSEPIQSIYCPTTYSSNTNLPSRAVSIKRTDFNPPSTNYVTSSQAWNKGR